MPKTIARGAMTGSMLSPRTVKDFRHFRNVWNDLSQGLVNISTIRIFLVVSHQGVLSLLIARLIGMPAESMWHFRVDQGGWSAIDINQKFATLRVLNSRAIGVENA
ncbi:alpha-ribazole-5'-phosphate phosphatase [Escherichia coli]|uniref:Alpha-ribazole-5'-phosphate phosphatase n=1 Tax=Escherichia coli TaxID=562 RepID=A0A376W1M7_ECOLX|nr:alpha-ribazole-5'-phosphate phosphatase [Escherichia coli]